LENTFRSQEIHLEEGLMPKTGTCKATDCAHTELIAKGYCRKHYRLWKAGEMPKPRYKTCTEEKCHKPRAHSSLCEEHWNTAHGKKAEAAPAAAPAAPA
jgi:hypothetical protein